VLLQTVKNEYATFGSNYLMQSVKAAKSNSPIGVSGTLEERVVYHDYYSNGNIQEVSKKDGTHIVYVWGYDQTVPIAKIENAIFIDIPTSIYNDIVAKSNLDSTQGTLTSENNLRIALESLRNHTNLANAMVTTFTYDPMIGVTSITDPRGDVIYYQYDGFNRLEMVKDKDGNILKENQYHYKN
jgi:YD repeat-containing protein